MVEDNFAESSVAREVHERAQCECVGEDGLLHRGTLTRS